MVPPDSAFHSQTRFFEGFAAHGAPVDTFPRELAFDNHLGGDAGVIGAREPERDVAAHAMPADGNVDFGVLQHVAHVERAGHVGRRDDERKDGLVRRPIRRDKCRSRPTIEPSAARTAAAHTLCLIAWK